MLHLRHTLNDIEKVEYLQYHLHIASAKTRRAQNTLESIQSQLVSPWSAVENYRQCFSEFTECFTVDVTDTFSGFLYGFLNKA